MKKLMYPLLIAVLGVVPVFCANVKAQSLRKQSLPKDYLDGRKQLPFKISIDKITPTTTEWLNEEVHVEFTVSNNSDRFTSGLVVGAATQEDETDPDLCTDFPPQQPHFFLECNTIDYNPADGSPKSAKITNLGPGETAMGSLVMQRVYRKWEEPPKSLVKHDLTLEYWTNYEPNLVPNPHETVS